MSTLTIRWYDDHNLTVLADGVPVSSASNDDPFPDETPLSVTRIAATVAEDVGRALGAEVVVEKPAEVPA